ncbi:MAG: translocation/assembly module TamB domain-containing protein [Limnothrix sp.]
MNPNEPDSSPKSELETAPNKNPKKKFRLLAGLAIGAVVVLGGGLGYARYFVYQKLSPQVEAQLADTLNRPLNLGEVRGFSLRGIRLGYSELPETPDHSNSAVIESVVVDYDLWSLLTKRQLNLDLTLVNPQIYLEQDEDNLWLELDLDESEDEEGGLEVDVKTVQIRNADVLLRARSETGTLKPAIALDVPYGKGKLSNKGQIIDFDLDGTIERGGNLNVTGLANFETGLVDLDLRAKKMEMSTVTDLLPLPFTVFGGLADGALKITLDGSDVVNWEGEIIARNAIVSLPQLAKPIVNANSRITFDGLTLTLNDLTGSLGEIAMAGELMIDVGQEAIAGKFLTEPVEILGIMRTFELEEPEDIVLEGKLRSLVTLTGPLENPQLFINAVNDQPLLIDRVQIAQFQGTLAVLGDQFIIENFIAEPTLGGQFQGSGLIQLPREDLPAGAIAISAKGKQLPTDALAKLYEITSPVPLGLGQTDLFFEASVDQPNDFVVSGTAVVPVAGGYVTATDLKITIDSWQTPAQARGLRLARLSTQELPVFLQNSIVNGEFLASGTLGEKADAPLTLTGQARTAFAGGQATLNNIRVADNLWRSDVALSNLNLKDLAPDLPVSVAARYGGNFVAAGSLDNPELDAVDVVGSGRLTLASGGAIRTEDVKVAGGNWYSRAELDNVNLVSFSPQLGQYVDRANTNGSLEVRGTLDNPELENILARGSTVTSLAGGTVSAGSITLRNGQFTSNVVAQGVSLSPFSDQLTGAASGRVKVAANVLQPDLKNLRAQGDISFSQGVSIIDSPLRSRFAWTGKQLQIQEAIATGFRANGTVDINSDRLAANPLDAISNLALNLSVQDLNLAGLPLPENVQAVNLRGLGSFVGTVKGVPTQPIVNGRVRLENAQVASLDFDPVLEGSVQTRSDRRLMIVLEGEDDQILARLNPQFLPEQAFIRADDAEVDLAVNYVNGGLDPKQVQLSSTNLPVSLIQAIAKNQEFVKDLDFPVASLQVGGRLSTEITGDLQTMTASGRLAVENPQVGYVKGDRFQGDFYFGNNNLMLQDMQWLQNGGVYTVDSTINLPENSNGEPKISLAANVQDGRVEDILIALQIFEYGDFQNLTNFSLPNYIGRSALFGNTADLYAALPLPRPPVPGDVPSLEVPDDPTPFDLEDGESDKFSCDKLLLENPVTDGRGLFARNSRNLSFPERIALVSCVQAQLALIDEKAADTVLPAEIADLKGKFNGDISLNYSGPDDLEAEFDLRGGYEEIANDFGDPTIVGQAWQWGEIEIPYVVAKGVYRNNILTLRPINIQLPDGRVSLIASLGGDAQTAQLRLVEVPVAFVKKFIDIPDAVSVSGLINANANLAGTPEDPSARGDMQMVNTQINGADISDVKGNFTYETARLDFVVDSELVAESEPLRVTGSIPYQLPNATVAPESNALNLTFDLEDEGFTLLNILSSGQLAWLDGEGNIDLTIDGELDPSTGRPKDLVAKGQAAIADATIQAQTLPDAPLTNVQGKIDFNFNTLEVRELTGDFSGGNVAVTGKLPISQASDQAENSLSVLLNNLDFELPNLYEGGVDGDLIIRGSALEPSIGGNIELTEGRIFLTNNQPEEVAVVDAPAQDVKSSTNKTKQSKQQSTAAKPPAVDLTSLTKFDDLKISLGRNVQVTDDLILNFLATGDLTLNGTLGAPEPEGTITLQRGQVNLFATQFRIDKSNKNTATFNPRFGLDPELDVVLQTSLIESRQPLQSTADPLSAEIRDTSFDASQLGSIETIRVQATVRGRASKLNENLELTSSPPRSETQLVALLGGTIFDTIAGEGSSTLALANLAGSALLNSIQDTLGNALGLSELRLFPTVITDDENRSSTLGLGAEIGINITPSLSFSALQILNSNESTQFGLRYRVNDEIFVRGSTNLQDDSRLTIEYDLRF